MTPLEVLKEGKRIRSGIIDTYTPPAQTARANFLAKLIEEKEQNEEFLFGDGSYLGIDDIIDLYWNTLIGLYTSGSISTDLTLSLIETWNFDNPVWDDDGVLKSPISDYITTNNLSNSGTTIYNSLILFLGDSATSTGNYTSSYSYTTQALALSAMASYDNGRNGSALLGTRTRDSQPQSTDQDSNYPYNWRFSIGDSTLENPDYWDSDIYTEIDNLLSDLNSVLFDLNSIKDTIDDIDNNDLIFNKELFDTFYTTLTTFISDISGQISSLTTYKNTLETLDDDLSSNRTSINTTLENLVSDLDNWNSGVSTKWSNGQNGNGIFGDPETEGTINNYRLVVLSTLNQFPDGLIEIINQFNLNPDAADDKLLKEELKLRVYGVLTSEYILKLTVSAKYNRKINEVTIRWTSPLHPNKFKIYRELSSNVSNNDEWSESKLIGSVEYPTDVDPDLGWTIQSYIDDTVIQGNIYVYRVKAVDDYWNGQGKPCVDSESPQSDVWDGSIIEKVKVET